MNSANIIQCLSELFDVDLDLNRPEISQNELITAQRLAETIKSLINCNQFDFEDQVTLDLTNDSHDNESEDDYHGDSSSDADDEWDNKENVKEHYQLKSYSIDFMKEVVDFADEKDASGKRRRSWKTVQHRYRSIPNQGYICRFRKYLTQQGTKRQKTQNVDEIVYKKFLNAREQYLPIHDIDIQRWSLQAAKEMQLNDFQASEYWLRSFKNRHGICSRKITNIVTKREISNFDDIKKSEEEFLKKFHQLSKKYLSKEILNTDQVGIEKELHSTRTLSFQGEKKTLGSVASKNATTHSYTIQPTINLDGQLVGPMYLCLQEPKGRMGDIVKRNLFEPKNVVITCSSSGKLTSSLVKYWRDKILVPSIGKKALLLSDSWSGQNDDNIYNELKSIGKAVHRIQIPPKTTSDIQPLDKYFNRQMKNLAKRLYNRVALDELNVNLYERNNIIKLVSLIHSQLSAPVFKDMILYSWYARGYLKSDPSPFKNVNDVCFSHSTTYQACQIDKCHESAFITCSWCTKLLCFQHFFIEYHFHE
ncbi:unnamed protein product [Rotaria sp. Silwood1]|nr:unnamed protein product [Rotaria sp. Silwood1]CAF4053768.1 unnamed protein product [Rotaria sp. Silwood1]CAF4775230.1 unnamed protein product [Rotaria sp. Silwood1]CAF5019234.1 unnamed protein product [Rotaria sp. Silwood1]